MTFRNLADKINDRLVDEDYRQAFSLVLLSFMLSVVSLIASIPHFVDDPANDKVMAFVLVGISAFSAAIFFLTMFEKKHHAIYRYTFMTVVVAFFAYLTFDGGPDGFLHFWILLIPAFSFVTFGIFEGLVCSIPMLIILIAIYWTPLSGYVKYADNPISLDFKLRLTFVYIISMILGFVAELMRSSAAKRLKSANEHYEFVSLHDSLTCVANQNFLAKYLDNIYQNKAENATFGCLFIDVDGFKVVNDHYGHLFGNTVLIKIAEILSEEKEAFVCRWGGDEFVVCFSNIEEDRLMRIGEKYRATVSAYSFEEKPDFHITVSIGAIVMPVDKSFNFNHVLELADGANRRAKNKGKDNVSKAN